MKTFGVLVAASVVGALGMSAPAFAVSINNQDARAHTLVVIEGDNENKVLIEANQQATGLCGSVCNVVVDDSDESYEVAADDRLVIEDGVLFVADDADDTMTEETVTEEIVEEPMTDDGGDSAE